MVFHNLPYEQMHAPVAGPAHPYQKDGIAAGMKNHRAGYVEDSFMSSFHFDDQYNTFHSRGYAVAPAGQAVVGDAVAFKEHAGESVLVGGNTAKRRKTTAEKKEEAARKAEVQGVVPDEPFQLLTRQPWADKEVAPAKLTEEQQAYLDSLQKGDAAQGEAQAEEKVVEPGSEPVELKEGQGTRSFFHGKQEKDFQGRSWLEAPRDARKENDYCYIPKRWVHTWSGHTKGVNAIRFFPKTGHLLLSAGLDGKVKIWDVPGSGKCMRTYMGHTKGVRDITFSNDGRRFLSAGYDKVIRYWDTETGKLLGSFGEGKMYYCCRLHPDEDKQNVLLAGCGDKKIYQWDMNSGELTQQYDYHLGAVNSISFIDENRRFVSTSDDKTIRVWEFGIPVQIKYIADPSMHSIPAVALSPNNAWWIGQSLDNQVVTYSTKDRFRQNRKKVFKGHTTAGYACGVNFSADGRYVISGDGEGRLFVWDWKTTRIFRTIKAHEGVCIGAEWHPLETSKVATCGWDGLIKYWD